LTIRLLIVSTLDSQEPFGAFTRPFYLGMYLARQFEVYQLGIDCSAVDYARSQSIGSRSLKSYLQAIQKVLEEFQPDVVYAQETLPGIAAWLTFVRKKPKKCRLVFDFHTLSAFEYGTRLNSAPNRLNQFTQLIKTYIAQGILIKANKPIIVASQSIIDLIPQWYKTLPSQIYCVSNGVADDLLHISAADFVDPYLKLRSVANTSLTDRPTKIVAVIAPKTFSFPTNDMSVTMTLQIARYLQSRQQEIHQNIQIVVIGRDENGLEQPLPANLTFTGFLPKRSDFLAHLVYADVGLLPFSQEAVAGGARNKALDYLACQKLVVSTPEGLRGLEKLCDRQHLLISGYSVEEIANTIIDACLNLETYQPLVKAAYQLVQEQYSWSAMGEKVAEIVNCLK
jgi:glycosyltransferase involved in cell wall biosynthesis